jgi:DNA polymerase-1
MRKYFGTFRKLDQYLRDQARVILTDRKVRTASGRMLMLRFDESDRQAAASAKRYGINMPIQGTSADILKRSLRLLHDAIHGTTARLVNIVHDEVIVECAAADAEPTAKILENAMCTAGEEFVRRVPVKVDVKIADDWTK